MIRGSVNSTLEAILSLQVSGPGGVPSVEVFVVVDTGFNGALTLPGEIIERLGLPRRAPRQAILADGSIVSLDVFKASVLWNGIPQEILVLSSERRPLLGMELLYGHEMTVQVIEGGNVSISLLE